MRRIAWELAGIVGAPSAGAVSAKDFRDFLALLEDAAFSWREDLTGSTWGRWQR
jgi:hypothetical protein